MCSSKPCYGSSLEQNSNKCDPGNQRQQRVVVAQNCDVAPQIEPSQSPDDQEAAQDRMRPAQNKTCNRESENQRSVYHQARRAIRRESLLRWKRRTKIVEEEQIVYLRLSVCGSGWISTLNSSGAACLKRISSSVETSCTRDSGRSSDMVQWHDM